MCKKTHLHRLPQTERQKKTEASAHLIAGLDLLHEDGQVLDAQRRVAVDLPVGSLDAALWVSVRTNHMDVKPVQLIKITLSILISASDD